MCYFHGTIRSGKILWSHPFPFKFPLIVLDVCKSQLTQFVEKQEHKEHIIVTGLPHLLRRSLAVSNRPAECHTSGVIFTFFFAFPPALSLQAWALLHPPTVLSPLSSTKSLHWNWQFTDPSVRHTSRVGAWGWEEAAALQKPRIWCPLARVV